MHRLILFLILVVSFLVVGLTDAKLVRFVLKGLKPFEEVVVGAIGTIEVE